MKRTTFFTRYRIQKRYITKASCSIMRQRRDTCCSSSGKGVGLVAGSANYSVHRLAPANLIHRLKIKERRKTFQSAHSNREGPRLGIGMLAAGYFRASADPVETNSLTLIKTYLMYRDSNISHRCIKSQSRYQLKLRTFTKVKTTINKM